MDSEARELIKIWFNFGAWRSLVARTAGGREVAGSNPVAPINADNADIVRSTMSARGGPIREANSRGRRTLSARGGPIREANSHGRRS